MSFTPAFQKVYDRVQELLELGEDKEIIQDFFASSCRELGAYERLNNLYRIRPKRPVPGERSRLCFFKFNKMQDKYWSQRTNRDLILKMRQGGITTLSCIIALDNALWEPGSRSAIMADTKDHVKEYFTITKTAFKSFQKDWGALYKVTEVVDNVNALKIAETEGTLLVCTNARGLTLDFLHIAEAAFISDDDISDSLEAVPLSGRIILETTADTASGLFYDLWDRSQKDKTALFKDHFFEWWWRYPEPEDIPSIKIPSDFRPTDVEQVLIKNHGLKPVDIIWRRMKISESNGEETEFIRKYPEDPLTCFLSGAHGVFPPEVLAALWGLERAPAFVGDLLMQQ